MKIKQNLITLTVTAVLFTLTSGLMVHADWGNRHQRGKNQNTKQQNRRPDLSKAQGKESGLLLFKNNTDYKATVYANVREKGKNKYSSTPVKLGEVNGEATTTLTPENGFIGRNDSKFWIEITDTKGDLNPKSLKKELKFRWNNNDKATKSEFSDRLKFEKGGPGEWRNSVEMTLVVEKSGDGLDMTLSPIPNK